MSSTDHGPSRGGPGPLVVRSRYVQLVPLASGALLCLHAVTQVRMVVSPGVARVIEAFAEPSSPAVAADWLAEAMSEDRSGILACVEGLIDAGILRRGDPGDEAAEIAARLSPIHGRDPRAALDRWRREAAQGSHEYYAVAASRDTVDLAPCPHRASVVLLGDCDVQMETDFLRREARSRGIDLRVVATFPEDTRLLAEHPHDAVIVGALRSRHTLVMGSPADFAQGDTSALFVAEARDLVAEIRELTRAPILVHNLPVPTVGPLGESEDGPASHRNRFRRANLELSRLAEELVDVAIVDVDAAMAGAGKRLLLDDALVGFTHLGSLGWMLQRPESEKAACHGLFPEMDTLSAALGGDPYRMEAVLARADVDRLVSVLRIDEKKCVVVDLDGTLWPGVLAETGAPFAWRKDISGPASFVGLYFGVHEALKCLQKRGILLACISKNDESTVRRLWRYPEHYPRDRLLTLDDFVAWRMNWDDKAKNLRAVASELGLALGAFCFVDDSAAERAWLRAACPEVAIFGEDPFTLRHSLLTDPRLQPHRLTAEAERRTDLVKAQLARRRLSEAARSPEDLARAVELQCTVARLAAGDDMARASELLARTTQFNTTGLKLQAGELQAIAGKDDGEVFVVNVRDRFGDQGLCACCVVEGDAIIAFAMSCRVIGLGVEGVLLRAALLVLAETRDVVVGHFTPTDRNLPARRLYADHGFERGTDGRWVYRRGGAPP